MTVYACGNPLKNKPAVWQKHCSALPTLAVSTSSHHLSFGFFPSRPRAHKLVGITGLTNLLESQLHFKQLKLNYYKT
jgi:hypothetical protein